MMREVLASILQVNLVASVAILIIFLLRKPFRSTFGAGAAYCLWLMVPVAAALSFAPARPEDILPAPLTVHAPLADAAEWAVAQVWSLEALFILPDRYPAEDPSIVIAGLWSAGMLTMLAWLAARQVQFNRLLSQGIAGPAVVGVLRPRVAIPRDFTERFDQSEQALITLHERVHLARHDSRINALAALCRCICWFNPLVHVAAQAMRIDQELACDAAVIAVHTRARASYAQALLKTQLASVSLPLGCYWPANREHPLTERIAMLDRSTLSLRRRLTGAVTLGTLLAGVGAGAWAAAPASTPAAETPLRYLEDALNGSKSPARQTAPVEDALQPAATADRPAMPSAHATNTGLERGNTQQASDIVEAVATSQPRIDPHDINADGRPRYGRPFVELYDADAPVSIKGIVVRVDWLTPNSALWVYGHGIGKGGADLGERIWRVEGGNPFTLSAETRLAMEQAVGSAVAVRGYGTKDKSCSPACRVNGREVAFADTDQRLIQASAGKPDCTMEEVITYTCPGSDKVSSVPPVPSQAEITRALALAGAMASNLRADP